MQLFMFCILCQLFFAACGNQLGKNEHESFVGFTAYKEVPQEFDIGDRILFEGVLINEGDAYQPALSQFTCPVSGVYYISINLMVDVYTIRVAVIVGEEEMLHVYSHSDMDRNTASNSGLVYCEAAETIYVTGQLIGGKIFGASGLPYSTFTVMLLSEQTLDGIHNSEHDSFSGFSVVKDDGIQDYENQDVITYFTVNYNDGNYLTNIHRYNCSKSGVYFINFNNCAYYYDILQLGIEKSTMMELHAQDLTTMNAYNTISNSRLIYCDAGEMLVVKGTGSGSVRGDSNYLCTSFNGFLLLPDGPDTKHDNMVGFSVYKRTPQSYNASRVISFDGILWDEDNSYDRVLNRFVCPVTGVYFITVTFMRHDLEPLYAQVEVQSLIVLRSEEASSENPWNTISNTVMVPCLQGWNIQAISTGTGSVYGDYDFLTTFTVFLLYEY